MTLALDIQICRLCKTIHLYIGNLCNSEYLLEICRNAVLNEQSSHERQMELVVTSTQVQILLKQFRKLN